MRVIVIRFVRMNCLCLYLSLLPSGSRESSVCSCIDQPSASLQAMFIRAVCILVHCAHCADRVRIARRCPMGIDGWRGWTTFCSTETTSPWYSQLFFLVLYSGSMAGHSLYYIHSFSHLNIPLFPSRILFFIMVFIIYQLDSDFLWGFWMLNLSKCFLLIPFFYYYQWTIFLKTSNNK